MAQGGLGAVVAQRIVEARRKAGLTQQQIADALRCHVTRISHIESGKSDLRVSTLVNVARALNVEPRELLPRKVAA